MPSETGQPDLAPTVALAVRPPVLSDALDRLLSADGVQVVVIRDDPSTLDVDVVARRYDFAVISGVLPVGIEANLVLIVAPPDGDPLPDPPLDRSPDVIDVARLGDVLHQIDRWRKEHAGAG